MATLSCPCLSSTQNKPPGNANPGIPLPPKKTPKTMRNKVKKTNQIEQLNNSRVFRFQGFDHLSNERTSERVAQQTRNR
eukprot:5473678-Amphidinium_carterae.2